MVNVQQVDKHHDLFKISLAGGFLDLDCEQNTHTLDPNCTWYGTLLYFLKNYQLPTQKGR